jgi:flagellar basal body-associated protein FliL
MKKEIKPVIIIVALIAVVALVGGLYYAMMGSGSGGGMSKVASPYGLPKSASDFQRPLPTGSGINAITGEVLPPRKMHPDPAKLMQPPGSH